MFNNVVHRLCILKQQRIVPLFVCVHDIHLIVGQLDVGIVCSSEMVVAVVSVVVLLLSFSFSFSFSLSLSLLLLLCLPKTNVPSVWLVTYRWHANFERRFLPL